MALKNKLINNAGVEISYYKISEINLVFLPKESYIEVAMYGYVSDTYRNLETEPVYTRAAGRVDYRLPYTEGEPIDRAHIYNRIKKEVKDFLAATDV